MEIIYLLIGFSLLVAGFFLGAFIWAMKSDQYDDEYGDSVRILHDDPVIPEQQQPNRS